VGQFLALALPVVIVVAASVFLLRAIKRRHGDPKAQRRVWWAAGLSVALFVVLGLVLHALV